MLTFQSMFAPPSTQLQQKSLHLEEVIQISVMSGQNCIKFSYCQVDRENRTFNLNSGQIIVQF